MAVSYWGVDHGDEVSKASTGMDKYNGQGKPSGKRRLTAQAFGGWHGAVAGKPGKKLRAFGNQTGGGLAGGYAGGAVGGGLAALATRGRSPLATQTGALTGSLAGGTAGLQAGLNRNQRKGYLKPEKR
jgi:hypothetical protein